MKLKLIGYRVYRKNGTKEFYPIEMFSGIYWDTVVRWTQVYEDTEMPQVPMHQSKTARTEYVLTNGEVLHAKH